MAFSDIHSHILCNSDDGAANESIMYEMFERAYAEGTRYICLTPHFHPGYFPDNAERSSASFELLSKYAEEKYGDARLVLGNELRYERGCVAWLAENKCRTLNGTKYVLIDFYENELKYNITDGLDSLLGAGYLPILAHAERYRQLDGDMKFFEKYKRRGVLLQIDTGSLFGNFGARSMKSAKRLIKRKLADFMASDAHDLDERPPGIEDAYWYVEKKCGCGYANAICFENAYALIFGN